MNKETNLAFEISRDLNPLFCELHHIGLSCRAGKDHTVVKVCCSYFRDQIQNALQSKYGNSFVTQHIRIQLPAASALAISSGGAVADE